MIVLFGATGDLAGRKLWPGLVHLRQAGLLPDDFRVIASGRRAPDAPVWPDELADRTSFVAATAEDGAALAGAVRDARKALGDASRTLFYMSVPPSAMKPMVGMLGAAGLSDERARIVMEKPFGRDLQTAKDLNAALHEHFAEDQIFRIDHFLGKEAAQDILALRFANGLFEPIWNREHVAAVQIDIPEALGLEGRASFYEETGAFRDMVVTHLSQILGFVAMEPPVSLDAQHLRDAKAAAFDDVRPLEPHEVVYGQFDGYRDEHGVDPSSTTETFVALRAFVDNDRWRDVPFLLRTGKALAERRSVVALTCRGPGTDIFDGDHRPNEVVFELNDDPELTVDVRVKEPGPREAVKSAALTLDVERALNEHGLEAYERLLHDVMIGDHLLFTRADEVERLWECAAPLLASPPAPLSYKKGSWGPDAALRLADPVGWRLPERDH
ncbi:MAG TPA: glucose-6-phosphate dehydrogenase [Baekduia sp.]